MINENSKRNNYLKIALVSLATIAIGLLLWKFDFEILFFIKDHVRNGFLDVVVPFYTNLGDDGIIWIALGIVLLVPKKTRKCGIMVLAALLVMLITNNIILKNLIARPRPCATYPELVELVKIPHSYSFPSGHTVSAMAVAFTVFFQNKKYGTVTLVLAFLMGLSRLYVGVHFPTDVFGGIIVGFAIAFAVYKAEKKVTPLVLSTFERIKNKKS